VTFRNDMNGQAIRRDEADNSSNGDPHEVWYRFAGKQIGFTGNNGAPDGEFANSPNGPFGAGGSTSPTYYTDFDLSLTSYAFGSSRSIASTYAVEQGDTLESIAAMLWGDSSLWYQLAEANGLQGGAELDKKRG
jgi:nucleoid-associated protein YgaU